jgi:hypothetical protein
MSRSEIFIQPTSTSGPGKQADRHAGGEALPFADCRLTVSHSLATPDEPAAAIRFQLICTA